MLVKPQTKRNLPLAELEKKGYITEESTSPVPDQAAFWNWHGAYMEEELNPIPMFWEQA